MFKTVTAMLMLTLFGYTSELPEQTDLNLPFDASSENGLVALAMDSDSGLAALSFSRIDPLTCHVTHSATFGDEFSAEGLAGDTHIVEAFEPGVWVVDATTFISGRERTITKFEHHTMAFRVKAGQFIQVGKLNLSTSGSTIASADLDELKQYLTEFPEINAEPITVNPWLTPFSRDTAIDVLGCSPLPEDYI
ncbi:MAG: hypothetical protein HOJ34_09570 [Kordiimonadaceae bacterium]|jgi:hypothetical protein|nr:hypothetical protein [Kordiimonadaceae bacterium]MBT6036942.1 hypothetical protein [Kordiimonadaceae bacterium]MBT6330017.1 hypothetical protein [Kordiimonadaceae bacterium]